MNKEQLAIEIYYAQSKDVSISVDDWLEKIEQLLAEQKEDIIKKIAGMKRINPQAHESIGWNDCIDQVIKSINLIDKLI